MCAQNTKEVEKALGHFEKMLDDCQLTNEKIQDALAPSSKTLVLSYYSLKHYLELRIKKLLSESSTKVITYEADALRAKLSSAIKNYQDYPNKENHKALKTITAHYLLFTNGKGKQDDNLFEQSASLIKDYAIGHKDYRSNDFLDNLKEVKLFFEKVKSGKYLIITGVDEAKILQHPKDSSKIFVPFTNNQLKTLQTYSPNYKKTGQEGTYTTVISDSVNSGHNTKDLSMEDVAKKLALNGKRIFGDDSVENYTQNIQGSTFGTARENMTLQNRRDKVRTFVDEKLKLSIKNINEIKQELNSIKQEILQLSGDSPDNIKDLMRRLYTLTTKFNTLDSITPASKKEIQTLRLLTKQYSEALNYYEKQKREVLEKFNKANPRFQQQVDALSNLDHEAELKISQYQQEQRKLNQEMGPLIKLREESRQELEIYQKNLKKNKKLIENIKQEINGLSTHKEELDRAIEEYNRKIAEIANKKKELSINETRLSNLQTHANEEIRGLAEHMSELSKTLDKLKEEVKATKFCKQFVKEEDGRFVLQKPAVYNPFTWIVFGICTVWINPWLKKHSPTFTSITDAAKALKEKLKTELDNEKQATLKSLKECREKATDIQKQLKDTEIKLNKLDTQSKVLEESRKTNQESLNKTQTEIELLENQLTTKTNLCKNAKKKFELRQKEQKTKIENLETKYQNQIMKIHENTKRMINSNKKYKENFNNKVSDLSKNFNNMRKVSELKIVEALKKESNYFNNPNNYKIEAIDKATGTFTIVINNALLYSKEPNCEIADSINLVAFQQAINSGTPITVTGLPLNEFLNNDSDNNLDGNDIKSDDVCDSKEDDNAHHEFSDIGINGNYNGYNMYADDDDAKMEETDEEFSLNNRKFVEKSSGNRYSMFNNHGNYNNNIDNNNNTFGMDISESGDSDDSDMYNDIDNMDNNNDKVNDNDIDNENLEIAEEWLKDCSKNNTNFLNSCRINNDNHGYVLVTITQKAALNYYYDNISNIVENNDRMSADFNKNGELVIMLKDGFNDQEWDMDMDMDMDMDDDDNQNLNTFPYNK